MQDITGLAEWKVESAMTRRRGDSVQGSKDRIQETQFTNSVSDIEPCALYPEP